MFKKKAKMPASKKVSIVVALVLAAALFTGSAFAYTDFGQNIVNKFYGSANPSAILHDDFEDEVNKDVYVENSGDAELIVRVRFNEYLQIGNNTIVGGSPADKTTWDEHVFPEEAMVGTGKLGEFDGAHVSEAHNHFAWLMTGSEKVYKPGTGNMGNYEYELGDVFDDGTVAEKTLPSAPIITMAEYMANRATYEAEENGRWILDEDGWAYWSKLLAPNTATNLLLDNVEKTYPPEDKYYYAIDVIMQVSNKTEHKDMMAEGGTEDGIKLIDYLAIGERAYYIPIDEVNFPNEYFRDQVKQYIDSDGDGFLSPAEVRARDGQFNIVDKGLDTAKGIEHLTELTALYIRQNPDLKSIDVSKNTKLKTLYVDYCSLTEIDISKNTELTILHLGGNPLTELDISENNKLVNFYIQNTQIKEIDVTDKKYLRSFAFLGTQIKNIDLSNNTQLTSLQCYDTPLEALDLSTNTALTTLYCYNTKLKELDLRTNTALTTLKAYNTQIKALDLSNNTVLKEAYCNDNELTSLELCPTNTTMTRLDCYNNQLTSLDVTGLTAMTYLNCSNNQIDEIDISTNLALATYLATNNKLTEIDISPNTKLTKVEAANNQLTSLTLNTAVREIDCANNQLTALDTSACTRLVKLFCNDNQIPLINIVKSVSYFSNPKAMRIHNNDMKSLIAHSGSISKGFGSLEWTETNADGEEVTYSHTEGNPELVVSTS